MTRSYRYRGGALAADYARGATGIALTLGPLAFMQPAPLVSGALAVGAALFLVYCARSVLRHLTRFELDEVGVAARGPRRAVIRWDDLRSLRLNYYAMHRDRKGGWMQLVLRGMRHSISIDSGVTGFADIAGTAAREASRRGRPLDERTRAHLRVLGICTGTSTDAGPQG